MAALQSTLAFVIWTMASSACLANNNLFLPGDAFFPTEITAKRLADLQATTDVAPTFEYSSLDGYEGAFCGYAGYNQATIPAVNAHFVSNLGVAYSRIREHYESRKLMEVTNDKGGTKLVETNGVRVLFYQEAFQFPKFELALRYNENWVRECRRFGHSRHVRLCCLVDDKDAVMASWRDSTIIEPLKVKLPDVEPKPVPITETPVTIEGNVKAYVLDTRPLAEYLRPKDMMTSLLVVDSNGVWELEYADGKWSKSKLKGSATEQSREPEHSNTR